MKPFVHHFAAVLIGVLIVGCGSAGSSEPAVVAQKTPATAPAELADKPLYQFSEREVGVYVAHMQAAQPDLHRRIVAIARKNLGQPYQLYLLGEAPFETIDDEPVYCLDRSDCVVFAEHTIAMALTDSWPQFLAMLQRIRYTDGHIGVLTRNHYTEADWNRKNAWLVRDITEDVGGQYLTRFTQRVDRAKFFKDRYKLDTSIAVETIEESFIPYEHMDSVKPLLRDGDVVNFVSGRGEGFWVGHVGLIAIAEDGTVNLIHSASPKVREEPMDEYIRRATADAAARDAENKARFRGFKFLRVSDDPWTNLRALDGPAAPKVTVPKDSPVTWEAYLKSFDLGG